MSLCGPQCTSQGLSLPSFGNIPQIMSRHSTPNLFCSTVEDNETTRSGRSKVQTQKWISWRSTRLCGHKESHNCVSRNINGRHKTGTGVQRGPPHAFECGVPSDTMQKHPDCVSGVWMTRRPNGPLWPGVALWCSPRGPSRT